MTFSGLERRDARSLIFIRISLISLVPSTKFSRITHVASSAFLGGVSHAPTAVPQRSPSFGVPSVCAYTLWLRTTLFDVGNTCGEGLVLRGSVTLSPTRRGWVPALPNFWGFLLFVHTFCRRTTKFDVVTHVGRGVYLGVGHASHPQRAEFQGSSIFGLHPLTQNDQIRHGNTMVRGVF